MNALVPSHLRLVAYTLLAPLFLWPLLAGGLYGETPRFIALWETGAAFLLVFHLAAQEKRPLRGTPVRWAAFALWAAYVAAAIAAAIVPRAALGEVLKHSLYLAAFLVASELVLSGRRAASGEAGQVSPAGAKDARGVGSRLAGAEGVTLAVWTAVSFMGLVSLVAAVGLLPFETVQFDRLSTFMFYSNSAASLSGAAFLVGLGLSQGWPARSRTGAAVRAVGQWVCLVALLLTMSRGAWLVFPFAFGLVLFLSPPGWRLALIGEAALTGVAALAAGSLLAGSFGDPIAGGGLLLAGLVAAVGAGWLGRWFRRLPARGQLPVTLAAILAVALAVGGVFAFAGVPDLLRERLTGFSLSEQSLWERLAWSGDALSIVKDYPIFGLGGGGWASRYFQYQSYGYFTSEIHNDFAQIWVEAGTLGFLAFLTLLGTTAFALRRLVQARCEVGDASGCVFLASLGGGAGMLILHSALDFNLTLAAMGIILWTFLGVVDGLYLAEAGPGGPGAVASSGRLPRSKRRHGDADLPSAWRSWTLPLLAVLGVSLLAASLAVGNHFARKGARLGSEGRYEESLVCFEQASKFDPLSSSIRTALALTMESLSRQSGDQNLRARAVREMQAAADLDSYNPDVHNTFGLFALRNGLADLGLSELEKALELHPFDAGRYGQVAQACLLLGQLYLGEGERERATAYLERGTEIPAALAAQATMVPDYVPKHMTLPAESPIVCIWSGKAEALLGHWDRAAELLEVAREAELCRQARETPELVATRQAEAAFWLSVVEEFRGNEDEAEAYRAALGITDASDPVLEKLRQLLSLAQEQVSYRPTGLGGRAPDVAQGVELSGVLHLSVPSSG